MPDRPCQASSVSCFSCQNRQRAEWCVLDEDQLGRFDQAKTVRTYKAGAFIYHEGDECQGIHCLESGLVSFRKYDADGRDTLVGMGNPGRTLGYRSLLEGSPHVTSAEATTDCQVCFIDRVVIRDMLAHNPALGYQFLRRAAKDLRRSTERYHEGNTLSVRDRFVHLLLILRNKYGATAEGAGLTMTLPLSRQDMAALVGTRPETLARTIHQIEDEGLARFSGRKLTVPSVEALFADLELTA